MHKVKSVVEALTNEKATGVDEITNGMIKNEVTGCVVEIVNKIFESRTMPE